MPATYTVDIGILTKVLDTANQVAVANDKLDFSGTATVNFQDAAYIGKDAAGAGFARAAGRTLAVDLEVKAFNTRPLLVGLSNNVAPSSSTTIGVYMAAGGSLQLSLPSGVTLVIGTWVIGVHTFRVVEFSDGFALFGKGGNFGSTWKLLWIDHTTNSATLYPSFQAVSQVDYEVERAALAEGNIFPLLSGDYTLAVFNLTSGFNQSVGSNTVVNGTFTNWTGTAPNRNPDNWNVSAESGTNPELTEVGPAEGHGGAGTGAANFWSTATNVAPIITQTNVFNAIGLWLVKATVTKLNSGTIRLQANIEASSSIIAAETRKFLKYLPVNNGSMLWFGGTAPTDITLDDVTAQPITVNTPQTMPSTDGQIDLFYSAPGTPIAGDFIYLFYRMTALGDEHANCWEVEVRKDTAVGYTINLNSVSGGTVTNRINTSGVGAQAIKIKFEGDNHQLYRLNATIWTKIGSTFNSSLYNTNVLTNIAYDPGFTITRWAGYRYANPDYDAVLDRI